MRLSRGGNHIFKGRVCVPDEPPVLGDEITSRSKDQKRRSRSGFNALQKHNTLQAHGVCMDDFVHFVVLFFEKFAQDPICNHLCFIWYKK